MITAAQLNAVANLLGTTDKNVVLSACIKTLAESGIDVSDAVDSVLGDGSYESIASDVYDAVTA